jgi:hypothetical protein
MVEMYSFNYQESADRKLQHKLGLKGEQHAGMGISRLRFA